MKKYSERNLHILIATKRLYLKLRHKWFRPEFKSCCAWNDGIDML